MYKCGKCNAEFEKIPENTVRCPACSHKIVYKARAPVAKNLKAR